MKKQFPLAILIILLVTLTLTLILSAVFTGRKQNNSEIENQPIRLTGFYQVDGGDWAEITQNLRVDTDEYRTVIIKGNFSREIPRGETIIFYIPCLYISFEIDGEIFYTFGDSEPYPYFLKSPGHTLAYIISPGIKTDTEITLTMRNAYLRHNGFFEELLRSMQTGSRSGLYERMVTENRGVLFFTVFLMFFSTLALILAAIAGFMRISYAGKIAAIAFLTQIISIFIAIDLNSPYMPLFVANPVLLSMLYILSLYLVFPAFNLCIFIYAGKHLKIVKILNTSVVTLTVLLLFLQLLNLIQLYEILRYYLYVNSCISLISLGIIIYYAFKHKDREVKLMLFTIFPIAAGGTISFVNYLSPINLPNHTTANIVGITLFLQLIQIIYILKCANDIIAQKQKLENELTENRISIMLSQIQPHFLYNSLSTIARLCRTNPRKAEAATIDFSAYLRGNMDSLTQKNLIPFDRELTHIKGYLNLEKFGYGDELEIIYNIESTGFFLPPLTVQPIVENAVKHGIGQRECGGTITISTEETDDEYIIIVSDDGIGMGNHTNYTNINHTGVGIDNVSRRLNEKCGGTLEIVSETGMGTTVTIKVPKDKEV